MNQLPTLEELDLKYVHYVILCSAELQDAARTLGIGESTLYRIRQKHNLPGVLPRPLTITFEEFLKSIDQAPTAQAQRHKETPGPSSLNPQLSTG